MFLPQPILRPAREEEFPLLAEIAFASKAAWGYSAEQMELWRAELAPSTKSAARLATFVATLDEVVVGFYQVSIAEPEAELEHLWVLPQFMRQGIGTSMMGDVSSRLLLTGVSSLRIDADPHAEAFYVRAGARRIGVLPAPIEGQPDRNRVILRLSI